MGKQGGYETHHDFYTFTNSGDAFGNFPKHF